MKILTLILSLLMATGINSTSQPSGIKLNLQLDADSVVHVMRGGIGASWHSMIHDIPLENEKYDYPVRHINPRGSAFAGNPPLNDTSAWEQVYNHASWLGMNFLRVELSMHMYEPERNVFSWENDEMQALYKILDWCEANGADVFLQQMWSHVKWNAFPGVHPLLSSPRSLGDFTNGIVTLLKHLTETRNYTCIKYFCMVNEPPGGPWGYWWSSGSHEGPTIADAWKSLGEAFRTEGLNVLLSGPDWTSLPPADAANLHFEKYLDAFDIHSYQGIHHNEQSVRTVADWVKFAGSKNKPFFITEIGNMSLGWGTDHPGPKSFEAALSNASDILVCLNLGVDAFNRWSFTNRGNMDGQWQLIKTYDIPSQSYISRIIPEAEAYYGFAMLTRFLGKYASVLSLKADHNHEGVYHAAIKNLDDSIVMFLINNRQETVEADIILKKGTENLPFYFYQVTKASVNEPEFRLNPVKEYADFKKLQEINLAPGSISVLTTHRLNHDMPGRIK